MLDEGLAENLAGDAGSVGFRAREPKKRMKISVGFTAYNEEELIETTRRGARSGCAES